jgi:hypothetical protein
MSHEKYLKYKKKYLEQKKGGMIKSLTSFFKRKTPEVLKKEAVDKCKAFIKTDKKIEIKKKQLDKEKKDLIEKKSSTTDYDDKMRILIRRKDELYDEIRDSKEVNPVSKKYWNAILDTEKYVAKPNWDKEHEKCRTLLTPQEIANIEREAADEVNAEAKK